MAKKGQKFKKYSPEFKEMILKEYFSGDESPKSLELKHGESLHTVETWVYKTKRDIDVKVDHRPGRSGRAKTKNLTLEDYKERYEILKKYQAFLQARWEKK